MDKVIVTGLLVIGAVAAVLIVITAIGPSVSRSSQAAVESSQEAADRLRTSIEIIAVAPGPDPPATRIDAWVKNVGTEPIILVGKSDVFVITPGTRYDYMTYNTAGGDNTWTEDPVGSTKWDRGDTLHMIITLPVASPLVVGDHQLRVSTRNGITADTTFSK